MGSLPMYSEVVYLHLGGSNAPSERLPGVHELRIVHMIEDRGR
jgi:hypothetical protein